MMHDHNNLQDSDLSAAQQSTWYRNVYWGYSLYFYMLGALLAVNQSKNLPFPDWLLIILYFTIPVLQIAAALLITVRNPDDSFVDLPVVRRFVQIGPFIILSFYLTGYYCRDLAILMGCSKTFFYLHEVALVIYGVHLVRNLPESYVGVAGQVLIVLFGAWWVVNQVAKSYVVGLQNGEKEGGVYILGLVVVTIGLDLLHMGWCRMIAQAFKKQHEQLDNPEDQEWAKNEPWYQ